MRYITITSPDINNGLGCRATIWVSGCSHNCPECHNKIYQNYNIGKEFVIEEVMSELEPIMEKYYIDGITLSGGDPLSQSDENLRVIIDFLKVFKETYPMKNIWIFAGDTYEEAVKNSFKKEILDMCDVMVDGPFILAKKDLSLRFRGSSNQRLIDVPKSLRFGKAIEWENF
jgi:anaerobic ribonucleoside-triphosphate reductase activating protein